MPTKGNAMSSLFANAPVISAYTRAQALEDGEQIDANVGDFAEVTRQHFRFPCYMTSGVFNIIERAVKNPRHCNDLKGVWHDVCFMGGLAIRANRDGNFVGFKVIIRGAGRKSLYVLLAECGPVDIDDPRPSITFMLPEER